MVGQNGGNGILLVGGAGAQANSANAGYWVGNAGTGLIAIGDGARMAGGTGATPSLEQIGLALGSSGGSGTISVYGTTTTATFGDVVEVGYGGTGLLVISNGATLNAGDGATSLDLGNTYNSSNGSGTAVFSAATANFNGVITDGVFGTGLINISNHSVVTAYASTSNGAAADWSVLLGDSFGSQGTLLVSTSAQLTTARGIAVGVVGYGELDVSDAGLYINQPQAPGLAALDVGLNPGVSAVVTVNNGLINDINSAGMIIGAAGLGTLAIGAGGQVLTGGPSGGTALTIGLGSGSTGNVWVAGPGSDLNAAGDVIDGYNGTGVISVWDSGQITAGVDQTASGLALGGPGGSGTLAITANGGVTVNGQADIGQFGAGLLEVTTGGTFSATAIANAAMIVGVSSGVTGSVLLSDPASLMSLTGGLVVGNSGSGTFTARNYSVVMVSNAASATALGVIVGANAGGSGTLSLTQSLLKTSAGVVVGSQGSGVLNMAGGVIYITAAPATGYSALGIGVSAGASGTVNVADGQIIDAGLAGSVIGGAGSGTLMITAGGVVQTGIATGNGLTLGVSSGGSGTVSINGVSRLAVSAPVIDGNNGTGSITLQQSSYFYAGNSVSAVGLALGSNGGSGTLSVNGQSYAGILGQASIGEFGTGTLAITSGSAVNIDSNGIYSLEVGNAAGSSGSVLITGANSRLLLNDGAQIGISGSGSLSLQNGGALISTNTGVNVQLGAGGSISLLGGTLDVAATLYVGAGAAISGQGSITAATTVDSGSISATSGTLAFLGPVIGTGSLNISGGADLSLGGSESTGVNFGAGGGTLTAASAPNIGGIITGWSAGDFVALTGVVATTETFANGTLSLFGTSSQLVGTLDVAGALASHNFTLTQIGNETLIGYHS